VNRDRVDEVVRLRSTPELESGVAKPILRIDRKSQLSRTARGSLILITALITFLIALALYSAWHQSSMDAYFVKCRELSESKNWSELARLAERWSQSEPHVAEPWLYLAESAEQRGDWEKVVASLDRVPKSDPRRIGALVRKAAMEFEQLNRPWSGVKTCDEILEVEPRVLLAHKQTIFFYAMTLQRAEMVRRIRRAIQVRRESPESYVYLMGTSWLYSGSLYRLNTRWLEGDPKSEIFQIAQALQVYATGAKEDLQVAAEFEQIPPLEEMLKRYPHNLELVAFVLNQRISDGDIERVQQLLTAVPPELADQDARFWRARAWCQDTLGEFEQAETSLRRALMIDPYWWQIHFQLHDLLRRRGELDESARFFKISKLSKALSIEIMALNRSTETLDEQKLCRSMLELAELLNDEEVAAALRERILQP